MPSSESETHWYLIHCKPSQDERAFEHLARQGYECYRPVRQVERWRLGRKALATESLFPRYLFIHLDSVENNWYPIRSTRGVSEIVRFNSKPALVQDEIVEGIRRQLERAPDAEPYFKPGEHVQITEGAFRQLDTIFVASKGEDRAVLPLNIMETEHSFQFPLHSIRKIS